MYSDQVSQYNYERANHLRSAVYTNGKSTQSKVSMRTARFFCIKLEWIDRRAPVEYTYVV